MTKEDLYNLIKTFLKEELIASVYDENNNIVIKLATNKKFYIYVY